MTAAQLLRLSIPGKKHELVDGIVVEMEPPGWDHGVVQVAVGQLLRDHVRDRNLGVVTGEVGFLLRSDPDTVLAPDVAFVTRERADPVQGSPKYFPGPPDLAIEIVSPDDTRPKLRAKALDWLSWGTPAVLIIDAQRGHVTVYRAPDLVATHTGDERVDLTGVVDGWAPTATELIGRRRRGPAARA
jgi:Uma2 family endonuclease